MVWYEKIFEKIFVVNKIVASQTKYLEDLNDRCITWTTVWDMKTANLTGKKEKLKVYTVNY